MATGLENLLTLLEANKYSLGTPGTGDESSAAPWMFLCALPTVVCLLCCRSLQEQGTGTVPDSTISRTQHWAFLSKPHAHPALPGNWPNDLSSAHALFPLDTES